MTKGVVIPYQERPYPVPMCQFDSSVPCIVPKECIYGRPPYVEDELPKTPKRSDEDERFELSFRHWCHVQSGRLIAQNTANRVALSQIEHESPLFYDIQFLRMTTERLERLQLQSTQLIHNEWAKVKSKAIEVLHNTSDVVEEEWRRQTGHLVWEQATASQESTERAHYPSRAASSRDGIGERNNEEMLRRARDCAAGLPADTIEESEAFQDPWTIINAREKIRQVMKDFERIKLSEEECAAIDKMVVDDVNGSRDSNLNIFALHVDE